MIKVASYDIIFQEIPGEVTLALNLSGCPCHCQGCHSPHLWDEIGEDLTPELLDELIDKYAGLITCVAFMGGDKAPEEVACLAAYMKNTTDSAQHTELKAAWYSGRMNMPSVAGPFDYVKIGPYVEALGGLKAKTTNQRLYKRVGDEWQDITASFWR
jgi:anaerobic ribonucleoside-triphosphate reductase activating protein